MHSAAHSHGMPFCRLHVAQRHQRARHDLQRCAAKGTKRKPQRGITTGKGFGTAPADSASQPCPCGSAQPYKVCCQPFHNGAVLADPENVLRSRYSAYVLEESEFLFRSYHPDSPELRSSMQQTRKKDKDFSRRVDLLGLTIMLQDGRAVVYRSPGEAEILFEVRMRDRLYDGPTTVRTERSTFLKQGDWWLYKASEIQEREEGGEAAQ